MHNAYKVAISMGDGANCGTSQKRIVIDYHIIVIRLKTRFQELDCFEKYHGLMDPSHRRISKMMCRLVQHELIN